MNELTVVVPTFNRAEPLRACLKSLARQSQPAADFEVVVVIDGSTDDTLGMLGRLTAPFALHWYVQRNQGAGAARNLGAHRAKGRVLLFLDDDMTANETLIEEHLVAHQARRVVGVGRIITEAPPADIFARPLIRVGTGRHRRLSESTPVFTDCYSGNLSIARVEFLEMGGFDTDLRYNEDVELGFRLGERGHELRYLPGAVATERRRATFSKIAHDSEADGLSSIALFRRHPAVLPSMRLGGFEEGRHRAVLLRRLMLAIDFPVWPLRLLAAVCRGDRSGQAVYGFIGSYAYWRAVRRAVGDPDLWARLTRGTLILMYHAFGDDTERPHSFVVPARRFKEQMSWLKRRGYPVISMGDLLERRRDHSLPPAGSIVLTIDDGYADSDQYARPILRAYGFPATLFVVTGLAGRTNEWDLDPQLAGRNLLTWETIHDMRADGIDLGAHTRTHPALPGLPPGQLSSEVNGSHQDLARELRKAPVSFAYPFGRHDAVARAAVAGAGFVAACSASSGRNTAATPQYALRRTNIDGHASLLRFALTVYLGVDLLGISRRLRPRRVWARLRARHSRAGR